MCWCSRLTLPYVGVQLLAVTLAVLPASAQPCPALSNYTALHPNCVVRGDCLEVQCTYVELVLQSATLTVHNCKDPVPVDLRVVYGGDNSTWTHVFNVTGEERRCTLDMWADSTLNATYSRNTTHLQFEAHAIVEGNIVLPVIPHISIPLSPRTCTCNDLQEAHDHFQLPVPGITHNCTVNPDTCTDFSCQIGYDGASLNSDNVIDPCPESVTVTTDTFHQVFTDTRAVQTTVEGFPITVYVGIMHYTYSMTVTVLMSISGQNITLLPEETIILDRSSCPNVNSFPAAPLPIGRTDECTLPATSSKAPPPPTLPFSGPGSTTGSSPSSQSLAVVVAVPVSAVVVLTICIAVGISLAFFCLRKKREVRFRRVAFQRMEEDDDDDMI